MKKPTLFLSVFYALSTLSNPGLQDRGSGVISPFNQLLEFYRQGDIPTSRNLRGVFSGRSLSIESPHVPQRRYLSCNRFDPEARLGCLLYKEPPQIDLLAKWLTRLGDDDTYSPGVDTLENMEQNMPGLGINILTAGILKAKQPYAQTPSPDFDEICYSLPLQTVEFERIKLTPFTFARIEEPSGLTCFKTYEGHIMFSVLKRNPDLGPLLEQTYTVVEVGYFD